MTPLQEVIDTIKHYRVVNNITQVEIAERMKCNVSFVQALEYKRNIDRRWSTIVKYAEAVGVDLEVEVIKP